MVKKTKKDIGKKKLAEKVSAAMKISKSNTPQRQVFNALKAIIEKAAHSSEWNTVPSKDEFFAVVAFGPEGSPNSHTIVFSYASNRFSMSALSNGLEKVLAQK